MQGTAKQVKYANDLIKKVKYRIECEKIGLEQDLKYITDVDQKEKKAFELNALLEREKEFLEIIDSLSYAGNVIELCKRLTGGRDKALEQMAYIFDSMRLKKEFNLYELENYDINHRKKLIFIEKHNDDEKRNIRIEVDDYYIDRIAIINIPEKHIRIRGNVLNQEDNSDYKKIRMIQGILKKRTENGIILDCYSFTREIIFK